MIQEAMATELLAMLKRVEQTAQDIDQISSNLDAKRWVLRQGVNEYSAKRVELLKQELQARGMTWCTRCSVVLPEGEVEFLLLKGREEYSCGHENSCYGFRDFFQLHRACPKCREAAADKHATLGSYDTLAKGQSSFYAFRVEKREDGYYARKFGNWVKLDDQSCKLDELSSQLVEKLAEEWNLPPRIEVKSEWPSSKEKFVIHDRAAMAKAV